MKNCPNCKAVLDDNANFCPSCGLNLGAPQPPYVPAAPVYDQFDHTSEYDAKDISDNKVFAMLAYILGPIGVIIALLASSTSPYVKFHIRQALKFVVVEILATVCIVLLFWTVIVPIAGGIFLIILCVIQIICFFQVCSGKAKDAAIIRSLNFLK